MQYWVTKGVLVCDQRVAASKLWVRLTAEDITRLAGSGDGRHLPTIGEVMQRGRMTREEVWAMGRAGKYLAYRIARGHTWEWRLQGGPDQEVQEHAVTTSGGPDAPLAAAHR